MRGIMLDGKGRKRGIFKHREHREHRDGDRGGFVSISPAPLGKKFSPEIRAVPEFYSFIIRYNY